MKIHRYAHRGEIAGVQRELDQGVEVDLVNPSCDPSVEPTTPIQCALASPRAGLDMVQFLCDRGATLSLSATSTKTDLSWAIRCGNIEKIQWLLTLGADIGYESATGYDALIDAMFSHVCGEKRVTLVRFLLEQGAKLDGKSGFSESALSVSSRLGDFEVVRLLLAAGSDAAVLEWTDLMQAIALGSLAEIETCLSQGADLTAVDFWERTPWLLSLQTGDLAKAQRLLEVGSNLQATGRCGKLPLVYALESGNLLLLQWLLDCGLDINGTDDFGETAFMAAVEMDQLEVVNMLLEKGANPALIQRESYGAAISRARSLAMVNRLVATGEDLAEMDVEMRHLLTQVEMPDEWELDIQDYQADKHPRFGDRNPQEMPLPFWREMVKWRGSAYSARAAYGDTEDFANGAVWAFQRFGQSFTPLPDGRVIEIAGEHEDHYDPDFNIYNDVVVYDGRGDFKIYGYPKALFPPTDFHTATLVDDEIYIIGNMGYLSDRVSATTPVYRLNCTTLIIEPVLTSGTAPGWISRHQAILRDRCIHITGGQIWAMEHDQPSPFTNTSEYILDLTHLSWHCVTTAAS
jgi:ankyrin repeat protein